MNFQQRLDLCLQNCSLFDLVCDWKINSLYYKEVEKKQIRTRSLCIKTQ